VSPNRTEQKLELPESRGGADAVDGHLVSLVNPASFAAEQYRALRHIVEQMHRDRALQVVAVTSPTPGDGKTTTAINLAGALAQSQSLRVLLVEADLRRPSLTLTDRLGLGDTRAPGLAAAILNPSASLDEVVRHHPRFALSVLPAGPCPVAYYEILASPRLGDLLDEARQRYDYVILDTPPAVAVPDCRVISRWVDGFLVVVAAHRTPLRLLEETLRLVGEKAFGLVFNGDDSALSAYYGYGPYGRQQPREDHRAPRWRRGRK
jgi:capsular exopolysaccharide synthesis family protein